MFSRSHSSHAKIIPFSWKQISSTECLLCVKHPKWIKYGPCLFPDEEREGRWKGNRISQSKPYSDDQVQDCLLLAPAKWPKGNPFWEKALIKAFSIHWNPDTVWHIADWHSCLAAPCPPTAFQIVFRRFQNKATPTLGITDWRADSLKTKKRAHGTWCQRHRITSGSVARVKHGLLPLVNKHGYLCVIEN